MGWGFPNHKPWVTPEWKVNEQSCWTRRRVFLNLGTRSGWEVCRGAEEGERQGIWQPLLPTPPTRAQTRPRWHATPLPPLSAISTHVWMSTPGCSPQQQTGHTTQMSCTRRTKVASTCWEDWGPLLKLFMTQQTSRDGWLHLDCTLNSIWGWKRAGC